MFGNEDDLHDEIDDLKGLVRVLFTFVLFMSVWILSGWVYEQLREPDSCATFESTKD